MLYLSSVAAFRVHTTNTAGKKYKVQLLVTRHGLSCANIAQKWISNFDVGRGYIHDTLLSGAGYTASVESAKEVDQWLKTNGFRIDAVLSSVLARAMQTALYMFPGHTAPLHVVPYIREKGEGLSNAPKPQNEQVEHLQSALDNRSFALDYAWVNEFGSKLGTWEEFLTFLEQFFLPDLISKNGGETTITLPVVTHSNFMRDSLGKCSKAWKDKGEDKPLNNQVVNMVYTFEARDTQPSSSERAATSKERTPSFFVLGSNYDDGRMNGAWVELEEKQSGKPQYEKLTDSKCKIQWSDKRQAWRMFLDNAAGSGRQSWFISAVDSPTLPLDGWEPSKEDGILVGMKEKVGIATGGKQDYGIVPRFVLHNAKYKLQEATEIPCDEVASGLSLKNDQGKRDPARLCREDVGDQCTQSIRNHSWCAGCLEIAEDVLKREAHAYDAAKKMYLVHEAAFRDKAKALHESSTSDEIFENLTVFGHKTRVQVQEQISNEGKLAKEIQSELSAMGKHQKIMTDKHAIITEVGEQKCLTGGHPEPPPSTTYW